MKLSDKTKLTLAWLQLLIALAIFFWLMAGRPASADSNTAVSVNGFPTWEEAYEDARKKYLAGLGGLKRLAQ